MKTSSQGYLVVVGFLVSEKIVRTVADFQSLSPSVTNSLWQPEKNVALALILHCMRCINGNG